MARRSYLGVAALLLLLPTTALAYFLPLSFVLGKLGEHHKRIVDIRVEHEAQFFGPAVPGGRLSARETMVCKDARAKRTTRLPGGERVVVYEPGKAPVVRGPGSAAAYAEPPGMPEFLTMVCGGIGSKALAAWSIDTKARSYHRYTDRIAYVIGAGAGAADLDAPQLWIDKDAFRPLRFSSAGRAAEVRLLDYESGLTAALYPRVAVFLSHERMLSRFVVRAIKVNAGLGPEDLR